MDAYKLSFKLFAENSSGLSGHDLVPVFHSWIQQKKVADHLVIDVADYEHVPNGPGTLLITLEANFAADREDGKFGLMYIRKLPFAGADAFPQRLRAALRPLLEAAQRLEGESSLAGKIRFRTDALQFRIYDRLLAPNTPQTFEQVKGDLEQLVSDLYGAKPKTIEHRPSAERLFEIGLEMASKPKLSELLDRLPAPALAASAGAR